MLAYPLHRIVGLANISAPVSFVSIIQDKVQVATVGTPQVHSITELLLTNGFESD